MTTLLAAGCTGPADPAPVVDETAASSADATTTQDGQTVTLTLGNALMDMPEQLIAWAVEVRDQTDDTITFDVLSEYGAADAFDDKEQLVLAAVGAGDLDLAWVGARALPTFDPLLAPMLVDSHDLQEAVFAAGVPDRMLDDLDLEGVTGLGVLPGPHRRVLGVTRDFRAPDDFDGAVVMSERNAATLATLEALGAAEPVGGAEAAGLEGLDAYIGQVGAVVGNSYQDRGRSFTANLNLWPRPLVLVASTEALDTLSSEHRQALLDAATDTLAEQMEIAREEDALSEDGRRALCSSQLEILELSADELAGLQAAVEPVLERLREDPAHAGHLREIEQLKSEVDAPPDVFTCEEDGTS